MFKHIKIVLIILALAVSAGLALSAGCGSDAALTDVADSISVNTLDGGEGVPVDSTFKYVFSRLVDTLTVTTSTFFIVKNEVSPSLNKAVVDDGICDPAQAIDAAVVCSSPIECTLTPAEWLEYSTAYSICLTSDIQYVTGEQFGDFMATFTTAEWILSSIKLVKLDDTELEFTDRPIPRMVNVKITLSVAVTDESQRAAFESAVSLVDGGGTAVDGSWTWAADYLSATFTPSYNLKYGTEYTMSVDTSTFPPLSLSKALSAGDMSFTTMADRDINGDGFADVVVGAIGYPDGDHKGQAYIFFGSATGIGDCDLSDPTCVPHAIITGKNDWDQLGYNPSVIGDVNADGFADIIIDARGYDAGSWKGRAYVFLGSASGISDCDLSAGCVPHATITGTAPGEEWGDGLGDAVSAAGDVNGDGYDDIIIAAPYYYAYITQKGQAYIFLGSASGIADCDLSAGCVPDTTITGENTGDWFGSSASVSTAGDVNADGYDDIIVGAFRYPGGDYKGRAYIFLGSAAGIGDCDLSDPTCVPHAIITGENNNDWLGCSVSNAGDVDGDGYGDVIVGAQRYPGGYNYGRAYIFLGSAAGIGDCDLSDPTCIPHAIITGENNYDWLGKSVSTAGDVNADGYADVILGATLYDGGGGRHTGRAYVLLGSASGIADCDLSDPACVPHATITGENKNDLLGEFVSDAGDINADGYADVIVGARGVDSAKGQAYILLGSSAGIVNCDLFAGCVPDATITGANNYNYFGGVK